MKKIIIAGATGYLGSHLVKELKRKQLPFLALGRNEKKLREQELTPDEMIVAEVTNPASLKGRFEGADLLISTVGITRQKDGLTYQDVDYQANMNLLQEAQNAGISKFIFISVVNGDQMRHLKIVEAKERFVDELKQSGMDYQIVRPNGFFSDMKDFLDMAKRGRVYLFGHGNYKLNPIHGLDLANIIISSIEENQKEFVVGGPDILTQNEIAEMALKAWKRPVKIAHLPDWLRKLTLRMIRVVTTSKTYGPVEFFLTMMGQDNIAPRYGVNRLQTYFVQEVDQISQTS